MENNVIVNVEGLTKVFRNGFGIFNVNLKIKKGQIYGFLGPNGAGKTTTLRVLMGYIKQKEGIASIFDFNTWKESHKIQPQVGYIAGEIAFPDFINGLSFIKMIYNLRKQKNWGDVQYLITYLEFDPNIQIKKMSKGMKQKLAIVLAFMHHPDLLILDEPTSGLDPLMQEKFMEIIKQAKQRGATVLMSSHNFSDVEKICDNVAIIKTGRIISDVNLIEVKSTSDRTYEIEFESDNIIKEFLVSQEGTNKGKYLVPAAKITDFFEILKRYKLKMFEEKPFSLEQYFLHFYKKDDENQKVVNLNV